ncbi:MAG: cupin domain-containing protein [Eubacteriales bacterium]|nr:cupin domain-containing protein [Eubacteriales bacterium]
MNEKIRTVADRLKELRESSDMTQAEMAELCGISPETYAAYESGTTDISIGFLYEVSLKCHVELTALLTGSDPKLKVYSLVRNGDGKLVERNEVYTYRNLAYNFSGKRIEPLLVTVPVSDPDKKIVLSVHEGQEFNFLLSGRLRILIDGNDLILEPGDSLYFDSRYPHGMQALDGHPAQMLVMVI